VCSGVVGRNNLHRNAIKSVGELVVGNNNGKFFTLSDLRELASWQRSIQHHRVAA